MDTKIKQKVQRYLELSEKFSKSEKDVFSKYEDMLNLDSNIVYTGNMNFISGSGGVLTFGESPEETTKREKYEKATEKVLKLVDDYDEYRALQKDLTDYFKAEHKLTK